MLLDCIEKLKASFGALDYRFKSEGRWGLSSIDRQINARWLRALSHLYAVYSQLNPRRGVDYTALISMYSALPPVIAVD